LLFFFFSSHFLCYIFCFCAAAQHHSRREWRRWVLRLSTCIYNIYRHWGAFIKFMLNQHVFLFQRKFFFSLFFPFTHYICCMNVMLTHVLRIYLRDNSSDDTYSQTFIYFYIYLQMSLIIYTNWVLFLFDVSIFAFYVTLDVE
jgi:hypothetical protein